MKCGIDVGSTLIKAVTPLGNGYMYRSTANVTKEQLVQSLQESEVDEVLTTGIGIYDLPLPLSSTRNAHPLSEIQMQVSGTKELMLREGMPLIEYCLVSIGTGISYTSVEGFEHFHLPVGSPIGGGYLLGMGRALLGLNDPAMIMRTLDHSSNEFLERNPLKEKHSDILYQDVNPNSDHSIGEMVVASCANITNNSSSYATSFAVINTVAIGIIKDLMMYKSSRSYQSNDIVCIGTASKSEVLQKLLEKYGSKLGLKFHFPMWGEYAAALGALIKLEKKAIVK